jgi:ribosomal protein S6E (S10)
MSRWNWVSPSQPPDVRTQLSHGSQLVQSAFLWNPEPPIQGWHHAQCDGPYIPILWKHFLYRGSLLSKDCSLFQVDLNWPKHKFVVLISGRNHKQDFPMNKGVLNHGRVTLLFYRPRITEEKHKSVSGCIVDVNLRILNLVIVNKIRER